MPVSRAVVFDDDDLFCYLFARIFRKSEIQASTYESPISYRCMQAGVDTCPVDAPCADFLLTDLKMPGMTGLEFLKRISQLQCKIPARRKAIVSGDWSEADRLEAERLVGRVFDKSVAKAQISAWIDELQG